MLQFFNLNLLGNRCVSSMFQPQPFVHLSKQAPLFSVTLCVFWH